MGTSYTKVTDDVYKVVDQVMHDHHEDLVDVGATVLCLFAEADIKQLMKGKTAIMKNGIPCAATIRQTSLIERVAGMADLVILIDKPRWELLDAIGRQALIDHELTHPGVKREKKTQDVCFDAADRPLFLMDPHDYEIGVFKSIISRYGMAAVDCQNIQRMVSDTAVQLHFDAIIGPCRQQAAAAESAKQDADLVARAVEVIRETNRATLSMLQRRLGIGHTKATKLMDKLEESGIVGPSRGHEPREILIALEEEQVAA